MPSLLSPFSSSCSTFNSLQLKHTIHRHCMRRFPAHHHGCHHKLVRHLKRMWTCWMRHMVGSHCLCGFGRSGGRPARPSPPAAAAAAAVCFCLSWSHATRAHPQKGKHLSPESSLFRFPVEKGPTSGIHHMISHLR